MRALERFLLLQIIDQRWREHLYDMDYLREGIHLRGFAQIEPLVAYKNEAFELFRDLMNSIWGDFARMIFHVEVTSRARAAARRRRPAAAARGRARRPAATARHLLRRRRRSRARWRWPPRRRRRRRGLRRGGGAAASGRAAPRRRERADRAQRPVLVRVGQEVQEVPRGVALRRHGLTRPHGLPRLRSAAGAGRPQAIRGPLRGRAPERGGAHRARDRGATRPAPSPSLPSCVRPTCRSCRPSPYQQRPSCASAAASCSAGCCRRRAAARSRSACAPQSGRPAAPTAASGRSGSRC